MPPRGSGRNVRCPTHERVVVVQTWHAHWLQELKEWIKVLKDIKSVCTKSYITSSKMFYLYMYIVFVSIHTFEVWYVTRWNIARHQTQL